MNEYVLLVESRKEKLIDKYQDQAMDGRLEGFFDDEFQQKTNFKYADWILKQYYGQMMKKYSLDQINDVVEKFHRFRKNLEKKDINQYKTADELFKVIDGYTKDRKGEVFTGKDMEKIYDDAVISVVKPLTHKGSCKYGASTKWCTASKDKPHFFDSYKSNGNLYYIHVKDKNKKYALFKGFSDPNFVNWYDETDIKLDSGTARQVQRSLPKDMFNLIDADHREDVKDRQEKGITNFEEFINNFDMPEIIRFEYKDYNVRVIMNALTGMSSHEDEFYTHTNITGTIKDNEGEEGFVSLRITLTLLDKDTVEMRFLNTGNSGLLKGMKELNGKTKVRSMDLGRPLLRGMVKQYTKQTIDLLG